MDFKKETIFIDTDARGTDDLCKMCGKCCRAIAVEFTHDELVEMAKTKQKEAQVFVDFFKKYDSLEDAKKTVPDQVEQVIEIRKKKGETEEQIAKTPFYYCEHIDETNKCTMHKDRPLCCRTAPGNGWSLMPPDCGYNGWQFEERERIKATIRLLKENLHEAQILFAEDDIVPYFDDNVTLAEFRKMVVQKMEFFKPYGALKW